MRGPFFSGLEYFGPDWDCPFTFYAMGCLWGPLYDIMLIV